MRTFQVVFRNGLTRSLEVTGYCKGRRGVVFMTPGGETVRYPANEIRKVEEVLDRPSPSHQAMKAPRSRTCTKERRSIAA